MELIFADPYYDTRDEETGRFVAELAGALEEFDQNAEVIEADIGLGADWPVALVKLFQPIAWPVVAFTAGPISFYFLGEKIKKNGEAWIEMARRLKRLFAKRQPARIDEQAALLIVLQELTQKGIGLGRSEVSVQVVMQGTIPHGLSSLDSRPEAVYVVTVVLDGESWVWWLTLMRILPCDPTLLGQGFDKVIGTSMPRSCADCYVAKEG